MPYYRFGEPGSDFIAHVKLGRRAGPAACVAPKFEQDSAAYGQKCGRPSEALCDAPVGQDLAGKALTCDAPMCAGHRTRGGENIDYCHRHASLAPAPLPLEGT